MKSLMPGTLCGLLLLPALAVAQPSDIRVENVWSRAAMQGRNGVIYLTITGSGAPDRLTGAAAPVAAKAELHESFTENGVAKMREVAGLPVAPGKPVTLAPGGYHIMLMGLKQELKPGDSFPVTLRFERAGAVTATVTVRQTGGTATGHGAGGMHAPAKSP